MSSVEMTLLAQPTLTVQAQQTLAELESIIERGQQTFVEVGQALLEIRERRLYREQGYGTFEDYCQERWHWERRHAYRMMDGAKIAGLLCPTGHIPETERQARELVPLLRQDEQAVVEVWRELKETYGDDVTAAKIKQAVATRLQRDAKEDRREGLRAANRTLVQGVAPLNAATRYATLVLDPPWDWGDEGDVDQMGRARPTYATMSIDDIAALPVGELAADDAHLYLWITNRSLPKGFALLERWGFRYVTMLTWVKPSFGMGNYFRGSTEHVLFGVRGSLPLLRRDVATHFAADRPGPHSAKPPEFYQLVESCSPGPWLELFARCQRLGWVAWGAEV